VAHSLSAKKRIRQNAKHRALNRVRKGQIKAQRKKVAEVLTSGDAQKALAEVVKTTKVIDKVAAKGAMHKKTASRLKSRLQKRLNKMKVTKS